MTQTPSVLRRSGVACAFVLSALALAAAACSSGHPMGDPGAPCYPNATCNAGLACKGGTCVTVEGAGGGATSGSTGHTSSAGGASGTGTSGTGGAPGTGGASGSPASTSTTATSSASTSSGADSPPLFLDFGTNVSSITVGQSVTFTAVLTDPNGIADLVGGALSDQNGATYGAFQASGQMGSFQLTVSWDQMNQAAPIDFAYGANEMRVFTAKFFDMEGKSAQMSTTITLTCNGLQAVAGACYDTMNDAANCGMVGHACSQTVCYHGECAQFASCANASTSCNAICTAMGKVCAPKCGPLNNQGGYAYGGTGCLGSSTNVGCGTSLAADKSASCCCF
jgi:hypothetical protein